MLDGTHPPRRPPAGDDQGFTLVEVIVAGAMLSVLVLCMIQTWAVCNRLSFDLLLRQKAVFVPSQRVRHPRQWSLTQVHYPAWISSELSMRALVLAAILVTTANPCLAETYCAASRTAAVGADGIGNNLRSLREQCQPGDTIVLEGNSLSMIAMTCDFSKTIIAVGQNIICVLSGPSGTKGEAATSSSAR